MKRLIAAMLLLIAVFALAHGSSNGHRTARDEVRKGVAEYQGGQYKQAETAFRRAVDFDPEWPQARLYLGTALAQQVVPGNSGPENVRRGHQALEQFRIVLQNDPNNLFALKAVASVSFSINELEASKDYYRRVIAIDPADAEAYYGIGVIDWTQSRQGNDLAEKFGPSPEMSPRPSPCASVTANRQRLDEGIQMFRQAIERRPSYADAMRYLDLLHSARAAMNCDGTNENGRDLKTANEWQSRTLALDNTRPERAPVPSTSAAMR